MDLKNAVVLVTGAGSGIGAAIASHFGKLGSSLFLVDKEQDTLKNAGNFLISIGVKNFETFAADISQELDSKKMVNQAIKRFGKINIVIPCAGLIRDGLLLNLEKETKKVKSKLSFDDWQDVLNVNLNGTFLTVRDCAEKMAEGGWPGLIVPISSVNKAGQLGQLNYSSSKIAISLFPKVIIGEFLLKKILNIRVVGIAPGYTRTPMLEKMNQYVIESLLKTVHLNRLIEPSEIAKLIEHISSNEALNGTTVEITGGICHPHGVVK